MASVWERSVRAARLDVALYEEVEADPTSIRQATAVVALSALAAGIGNFGQGGGLIGLVMGALLALAGWYLWAYMTYFIGTRWLAEPQTRADHGELLRTLGFAAAPGMIRVLGVIPMLREIVFGVAAIWMLITTVIAVRQALDYRGTGRAILVCGIGWVIYAILVTLAISLFGGL